MDHAAVGTLLFRLSCGPESWWYNSPEEISSQALKTRSAVPKTNFKYSYERRHLRNFHHQWEGGRPRRHEEMAGLTLTRAVTYSPLVWNVRVRTIRGRSLSRPLWHLCIFSSGAVNDGFCKEVRQFGIENHSVGRETLCRDNESKWVYLLGRWRRVCISGSSYSGKTEKVIQNLHMSQIFT